MINPAYLPFILAGGVIIFLVSLAFGQGVGCKDFAHPIVPDAYP